MLAIGHRGAMGHAPENTLASVERAIELGADCVEIDVHVVEGRLVVIHDDRVDRTTNGIGALAEMTFATLRALDAGGGERIPTLEEVLDRVDRRAGVNVELKGRGTAPPVVACLAARLARGWRTDHFLVSSFQHRRLTHARALDPRLRLGALVTVADETAPAIAQALGAWSIHPPAASVEAAFVRAAHAAGLRVYPFTADDAGEIARMRSLGADGVFTNYPDRVEGRGGEAVLALSACASGFRLTPRADGG